MAQDRAASSVSVSVSVRCEGALHTISIAPPGAVVLHDHPDRAKAEHAFIALGGAPCRCLQVLAAWRQGDLRALPAGLRPVLAAAVARRLGRLNRRQYSIDPLTIPVAVRTAAGMNRVARKALVSCAYRRSQSSWAGGDHEVSVRIGQPDITGGGHRVWSANGKWSGMDSYVRATVPLAWYVRVYRRGLAVVAGCFVLDVLAEDTQGITVLAGRQGRGFAVYPAQARITTAKDGSLRLRWLEAHKEAE